MKKTSQTPAEPDPRKWPWVNPLCRGCKHGLAYADKDTEGQIWQEMRCLQPEILAWMRKMHGLQTQSTVLMLDRPCKKYERKRTRAYKPKPKQNAFTSFKYE